MIALCWSSESQSRLMMMARTAGPDTSTLFAGRDLVPPAVGPTASSEAAASRPKRCFVGTTRELLRGVEHTVARIEHQGEGEPALRALSAALLELETLVVRDPGIKLAADDLFGAAVALVAGRRVGSGVVEIRRWRLLRDATVRLRALPWRSPATTLDCLGLLTSIRSSAPGNCCVPGPRRPNRSSRGGRFTTAPRTLGSTACLNAR